MWFLNKKDDVIKVNKEEIRLAEFEKPNISPIE